MFLILHITFFFVFVFFVCFTTEPHQSHTTVAVVDCHSDGSYVLKALKQKLYVDGLCYLLQEIYGIENKNAENAKVSVLYKGYVNDV